MARTPSSAPPRSRAVPAPERPAAKTDRKAKTDRTAGQRAGRKQPVTGSKRSPAVGSDENQAVKDYLEALARNQPKKGRRATLDSVQRRLGTVRRQLAKADPLARVQLLQEQMDLEAELASSGEVLDIEALEDAFIGAARAYSEREGISYGAWRAVGVDADLLRRAGVPRTASRPTIRSLR